MNSVEKRHSSRRSSGHRKQSDGGYSDTSSAGSFPDETDREVSNLTDRAFRSLCIGDEAVYNDSDLSGSSPSTRTERQQAFFQSGWPREDAKGRGQGWPRGAESQVDPGWAGSVEGRIGGRASAAFQQALVDGPPRQRPLDQEHPCLHSNGAPEFSTQEHRSRSRVSSLIKAFNSDGRRDGAAPDGQLKDWNSEANWDRSALMSIQRELSEFSTAYGQNLPSGPHPLADPYWQGSTGAQESFYSSQAHMDSPLCSSLLWSSHSQQAAYGSPGANVFIHSEFSPFRVWQAPDRFPFRHRDVPGYTIRSDFQSWYETPLYRELSLGPPARRAPAHEPRAAEPPVRIALEHGALPPAPRSSSASTVLHKASAVKQRCESEFAEFHRARKRTQSLGTKKLPPQRPSTVSPSSEVSRRGLLNPAADLQRFGVTTAEHSLTAETVRNPHQVLSRNDGFLQFSDSSAAGLQAVGGDTCTPPSDISQPCSAGSYSHQEVRTSEIPQGALSPPAMEHAPVRAESRGVTSDARRSSYKARATSLLFNLKDNRKRVKSTYSPTKFKGLENVDRSKPVASNDGIEHRDTVINIPDDQDSGIPLQQGPPLDPHATSQHPSADYHSPWAAAFNPRLSAAYGVQSSDCIPGDYLAPPTQSEVLLHDGFHSYSQDGYRRSPLSQGYIQQQEYVPSFAHDIHANKYQQSSISGTIMAASAQPESVHWAADAVRVRVGNTNHTAYQMMGESDKQWFNESMRSETTHADRHEQVRVNKYDFTDVSSNDSWKHQETPCVNDDSNHPWQTEAPPMAAADQNAQFYPKMYMWPDISPQQKYGSGRDWNMSSTGAPGDTTCDGSQTEGLPGYPQMDGFHTRTSVHPQLSNQPHQVQHYSTWGTQSAHGDAAASEKQLGSAAHDYGFHDQQDALEENPSVETYPHRVTIEQEPVAPKSYSQDGHKNDTFAWESSPVQQDVQVLEKADKLGEPRDAVTQQHELNPKETTSTFDQPQCRADTPLLNNQDPEKQVNIEENTSGEKNETQHIQTQLSQQIEWAQTLQTKLESVRAGLAEDVGTRRATEGQRETLTDGISGRGQPHVGQTIMNEPTVAQSRDVNVKVEEDTQPGTRPADRGLHTESQRHNDDGTTVELRERSTAGEAEVEVIQNECIETITLSPDGEARGEATQRSEQVQLETGAPVEHIKALLSKTGTEKAKPSEMEDIKSVHSKVDIKEKGKDGLLRAEKIDADPPKGDEVKQPPRTKQAERAKGNGVEKAKDGLNKALIERDEPTNSAPVQASKPEQCVAAPARKEYAKVDRAKEKRENPKTLSEKRMEHSVESLLIRKAQKDKLKQEPNRVEKVKTELAEAKAELGKMRAEQKRKQTHAVSSQAVVKHIVQREKQPTPHQPLEQTPVIRPVDEYERVREKYGFSKTLSTNGTAVSAHAVTSPMQEMERSQPHSDKGEEASDYSKPRDEERSQSKAATREEGRSPGAKDTPFSEDCYVYSETSKEFKLSNPNYSSTSLVTKQTDAEMCMDKNTKDNGMNTNTEPVSANVDIVSQPVVSIMNPTKYLTHERKPNQNKDSHATPSRTLTHKERNQTKQEILTSKIKAHAEKEISAIKEKHLASGKSVQQRRPSQELPKPPDKNISHSVAPRDQQATVPVKASIPGVSETAAAVTFSKPTPSIADSHVPKGPSKSVQNTVIKQALISNQTKNNDEVDEELKPREPPFGTKAASLDQDLKSTVHGKLNVIPQAAEHINTPTETKAHPPPSLPAEGSPHETAPTSDIVTREMQERPEVTPSIKFVLGQNEPPANDDSLQIMGIMVTVREKTVSINDEDGGSIKEALEKAEIDSEINDNIKPAANLRVETTTENIKSDISNATAAEEKLFVLASQPAVGTIPSEVGANNHPENKPKETTDRLENKMAGLTDKRLTRQEEGSLMRKTSNSRAARREDPVADKEDSPVIKPAPSKPGKSQPILFKQGKITEKAKIYTNKNSNEAKSNIKTIVEAGNDPSLAKAVETESNPLISSLKNDTKSSGCSVISTKPEKVQDGRNVLLLADKGTYSFVPEVDQQNKNNIRPDLKGPENVHISLGKESVMTPLGETSPDEGNVHIGCIAIRVMPGAIEQDNHGKAGKEQVATQSLAEMMNTERDSNRALPSTPAIKPSHENIIQQVQHLSHDSSSTGYDHQSSNITDSTETTKDEDETHQQSKIAEAIVGTYNTGLQDTEEEYFQFQGVTEINQEQNDARLEREGMQGSPKHHTGELRDPETPTSGDVTSLHLDNHYVKREEQKAKQATIEDKVLDNNGKTSMESTSAEHVRKMYKSEQESKKSHVLPEEKSNQKVHIEKQEDAQNPKPATPNAFRAHREQRHVVWDSHTAKNSTVSASKEQPRETNEAKPKTRVSTIPEISAIADYARLKVIVADDGPETIQEFPPNKKEGFFPMIQSRPSRRPAFTPEATERQTVNANISSKEPKARPKVNKEPKSFVFSTMEQDHKRTGMFKLREKENVPSDVKTKDKSGDGKTHAKDPTVTPPEVSEDFKYFSQDTTTAECPAITTSANVNRANTSLSQCSDQPNNFTTTTRPAGGEALTQQRTAPQTDHNTHQQALFGKVREPNRAEKNDAMMNKARSEEREREKAAKQKQEHQILQQIDEERRATLESQRREERRTREREARAARIGEERREAQRRAEERAEEERAAQLLREKAAKDEMEKKREEERVAEEERRKKQREEERRKKETEERIAAQIQEEMRRAKQREEEEERRAREEEMRRAREEEEMRRAREEEEMRRAREEEVRRAREEEEMRRAREEEEERRAREEEEMRRAREEEVRRAWEKEEMRRAREEEEEVRRAWEEEVRRAREEEEVRRAREEEEVRRAREEEDVRRAREEEEEVRRAREEETRALKELEDKKRARRREEERRAGHIEEEKREREERAERARVEEEQRRARHMEIEQRIKEHEEKRAAELEEEQTQRKREEARRREARGAHSKVEVSSSASREAQQPPRKVVPEEPQPRPQVEVDADPPPHKVEQRKAALLRDALQYYAIASAHHSKDNRPRSPAPPLSGVEPAGQAPAPGGSLGRPQEQSPPAPAPPRSTTCSPAPGPKPTLFRVKDNTFRASALTRSVKPRLHKSFGEDFRVGSPLGGRRGSDRAEDERDRGGRSAGTPDCRDTATRPSSRAPAAKESPPPQPPAPEHRAARPEYRPPSRRSLAAEEDDSRSCVSNMSEDAESLATSAGDLWDFRSFCDRERPESACSLSSDVARSLGKPPSVPPKSDKALRRAQRLTTRRMKRDPQRGSAEAPEGDARRSSASSGASELRHSSYRHARAAPHSSAPFSPPHAPPASASGAEAPSAYRHPRASLHASPRDSLPAAASPPGASPHATAPISIPAPSPHADAPAVQPVPSPRRGAAPVAPEALASAPSSPVLRRRADPAGPVRQYHVEPGYSQSYPLTQPKVLQDPGSGQYYVVDMPVEVETKTFFDPETGKYVQLNVRQTDRGGFRPLPQPAGYPQPLINQPPAQVYPQVATPGTSYVVYPGYPPGRPPLPVAPLPPLRPPSGMSVPEARPHTAQSVREGQSEGYNGYNSEETPYMDTAHETDAPRDTHKAHRGPYEKLPQGDTSGLLQGGPVRPLAQSGPQRGDIITMSELEDFMDVSDW